MTHSKTQRLLTFLQKGGTVTSGKAWLQFGISRCAAVIFKLRRRGYSIETIPTKRGKDVFASYKMSKL